MNISTAFRAFFAALFNKSAALRIAEALENNKQLSFEEERQHKLLAEVEQVADKQEDTTKTSFVSSQNEAITLLAAMQREARFVDFIQEPLAGYSDAQIGAAARKVHDDCAKVLHRFFEFKPVIDLPEESKIEITREDLPKYQLSGNVNTEPPFKGKLIHGGWLATKIEIPKWTGKPETSNIIASAEVEI